MWAIFSRLLFDPWLQLQLYFTASGLGPKDPEKGMSLYYLRSWPSYISPVSLMGDTIRSTREFPGALFKWDQVKG